MDKHNKMLIDATHPEETRVVVLRNGRVEEFDFESASRKLLRGNIYLAKVTRVEPSLQAAFVEYGGNRHGFLAFSEIHPDYYQIPVADREALKQAEAEAEAAAEAEADERVRRRSRGRRQRAPQSEGGTEQPYPGNGDSYFDDRTDRPRGRVGGRGVERPRALASDGESSDYTVEGYRESSNDSSDAGVTGSFAEPRSDSDLVDHGERFSEGAEEAGDFESNRSIAEMEPIEEAASEADAFEEVPERPRRRMRQYKIQEVIKRRQIILVQVVKEERGNKGAALTTYISLAGRYTVLMPNTGRGGGISRKITQAQDRKRLKAIAEELEVPDGMGLIIRTAGAARTMQEIRRDYEYLLRLWENVRDLTLASTAPCLVYEEGNLIKRSIRDLYNKDTGEILVAGEPAFREAHQFMGMLMPGHSDDVIHYRSPEPLFNRFGIERQLNAMFNPMVTLRSGGYIVINQTEALVAIDVNSGRSTREFSIEETALNTNIEAAEEIARQLKLRDLAGLIVIDFIDMEEKRNNRTVERRLKDALRHDRARIQVGRISHFGLLEMSRQRLRTGVVEGSTSQCPHCQGTGTIRSIESIALVVLRGLEEQLMRQPASVVVQTNAGVALYILNNKRPFINEMERRFGISISIEANDRMHSANFAIERAAQAPDQTKVQSAAVNMDWGFDSSERDEEQEDQEPARNAYRRDRFGDEDRDEQGGEGGLNRRRRRRRRGGRGGERFEDDRRSDSGSFADDREQRHEARDRANRNGEEHAARNDKYGDRYDPSERVNDREQLDSDEQSTADRYGREEDAGGYDVPREKAGSSDDHERNAEGRSRRSRRRGRRGGRSRTGDDRGHSEGARQSGNNLHSPAYGVESSDAEGRVDAVEREPINDVEHLEGRYAGARDAQRPTIVDFVDQPPPARHDNERRTIVEIAAPASSAQSEEPEATQSAQQPSRKGWWQRRFGGGD